MSTPELIDTGRDLHTHSTLTDGAASPEDMADAAVRAGLDTWGLSDHVRAGSDWLPDYVRRVRAIRRPGLQVLCGVEAKILDRTGRLDLPAPLPALDYVLIADHQFPGADGPVSPRELAARLEAGNVRAVDVVADLVTATCRAVALAPHRPIVVHPFSLLPKTGLSEADVGADHLAALARACLEAGAAVEVNEKWRCPSASTVRALVAAGVEIVAGSDAHDTDAVGRWRYLPELRAELVRGEVLAR